MRVGIDNVAIARMKDLSPAFPKRILSPLEYETYLKRPDKDAYLASRFAAKEAYVKASGRIGLKYSRIEVRNDPTGRPLLYVDGIRTGELSLTHDVIATAIVVLP